MAAKKEVENLDPITVVAEEKKEEYAGPMTTVRLPKLIDEESGAKVDQYEHVTISNEQKTERYKVLRGEPVDVPVPVFIQLHERYGNNI